MLSLLFTVKTMTAGPSPSPGHRAAPDAPGAERQAAVPLDKLPARGTGTVRSIVGRTTPLRQRLMELGITIGSEVQVIRKAPFGGPIEISVRGYRLSLRRTEARIVLVDRHR
jgi:Fe2+ transport system protein FeoA